MYSYMVGSNSLAATMQIAVLAELGWKQAQMIELRDRFERGKHAKLGSSEVAVSTLDSDGLGVWIGAESQQPTNLLTRLRVQFFANFVPMGDTKFADGRYWAHFRRG